MTWKAKSSPSQRKSSAPETSLRSLFDPIVKPSMKESWEATWKTWFVTTNEIWDIRKPGKLKGNFIQNIHLNNFVQIIQMFKIFIWTKIIHLVEFAFRRGRFIALSSKCYYAFNTDNENVKAGHKGVPYAEAQKFGLNDFESCLYDNVIPNVIARELRRNKKQQIIFSETFKKGLNPIFKKFRVQSDKISCLPLTRNGKIL